MLCSWVHPCIRVTWINVAATGTEPVTASWAFKEVLRVSQHFLISYSIDIPWMIWILAGMGYLQIYVNGCFELGISLWYCINSGILQNHQVSIGDFFLLKAWYQWYNVHTLPNLQLQTNQRFLGEGEKGMKDCPHTNRGKNQTITGDEKWKGWGEQERNTVY